MDPEPISLFLPLFSINWFYTSHFIVLTLLLLGSALISGTEVAFFSLSKAQLDNIKDENLIVKLLKKPKKLLGTILITNNFINILIVLLFASVGKKLFENLDYTIDLYLIKIPVLFLIEVVLITFLILLFGEVLPKIYATRKSLQFANFMAKPIHILNTFLSPFSSLLINLTGVVENRLVSKKNNLSVEKLSQALELTSNDSNSDDEHKILEGIVNFGNTETVQIMKPRIDICAISDEASYEEVLKTILKNGYSRNPVYHENIDNIMGVLYAKDLLAHLNKKTFKWQSLIRKPFFVPENKKLDDLLSEFQEIKNHLAIVVDEYGGTSGIVTLEDVIEEIVGDINDEFDDDDLSYTKIDNNNFLFDGKTTIKDYCRVLGEEEDIFEEEKGESETLAGLILEISGKFPKKNAKIKFKNYTFTIQSLDRKRIKQVKVTRHYDA